MCYELLLEFVVAPWALQSSNKESRRDIGLHRGFILDFSRFGSLGNGCSSATFHVGFSTLTRSQEDLRGQKEDDSSSNSEIQQSCPNVNTSRVYRRLFEKGPQSHGRLSFSWDISVNLQSKTEFC